MSLAAVDRDLPFRVVDILGDDAISARLLEMGVVPGTTVTVIGAAMAGDPIELDVRNYRLTIRRREAERVLVEPARE